jgi:hypothetical protein
MHRIHARAAFLALAAPLAFALVGCGPAVGTVAGKVLIADGKPVANGTITFVTAGGARASSIGADGSYTVENIPVGSAKVSITPPTVGAMPRGGFKPPPGVTMPPGYEGGPSNVAVKLDKRFTDPETSGLTHEVKSGKTEYSPQLK